MVRKVMWMAILLSLTACAGQPASQQVSRATETQTDEAIAAEVHKALNADAVYYFKHVDVQVSQGVVTLSGYVWSTPAIYRAKKIASGVPGVTGIANQLELEREGLQPSRR